MSIGNRSVKRNRKLHERMNENQLARRKDRIRGRSLVAAQLQGQMNMTRGALAGFVNLSLWSRLRWLVLGPNYVNAKGTAILAAIIGVIVGIILKAVL